MVCSLITTTASGGVQGEVVLVIRDRPQGCSVESIRFHGPNMVSCKVVTEGKWIPIIGTYLHP